MQHNALILLISLAPIISGCSSIISRSLARVVTPPPPMYFGGVRSDYMVIAEGYLWQHQVYGVADMPFSLVADVVLAPYDVYTDLRHTNSNAVASD